MAAGLKTIIALSFVCHNLIVPFLNSMRLTCSQVLAIGFLLVILSSALFQSYLTLLVVATYVIAPLPNWICGRCANPDDFMESSGSAIVDFGRFCTGFLVVMGVGMASHMDLISLCTRIALPAGTSIPADCTIYTDQYIF